MIRTTKPLKSTLLIAAFFVQLICSANVSAESSVWKVSKDGDHFYLGGTFHLLAPEDHPLPEEFLEAYANAQELIFETDIASASTAGFQFKIMRAMQFGDDRTLASELSPETYARLKAHMDSQQLSISQFQGFKPWGVAMMITLKEYEKLGMDPRYGVETYFNELARKDAKEVQSLETTDEQLEFLSSLGTIDGDVNIDYTLRDIENIRETIDDLKNAWRTGDLSLLESSKSVVELKENFPDVYNALLTTRNNNWMKQLVTLFDDNAVEIVLVGAMHLAGDDGLISQLRSQGFLVEQLD